MDPVLKLISLFVAAGFIIYTGAWSIWLVDAYFSHKDHDHNQTNGLVA